MLTYSQSKGLVLQSGCVIAHGWAGNGAGKNNPDAQSLHNTGPLPCGIYVIGEWEDQHPGLGPLVAPLLPDPGNQMYGRSGFYIHGPSMDMGHYGQESKGCIVIPRSDREVVKNTRETRLEVIP